MNVQRAVMARRFQGSWGVSRECRGMGDGGGRSGWMILTRTA